MGITGNQLRSQRPSQTARPEGHPVTSGNDRLTLVSQTILGSTGNHLRSQPAPIAQVVERPLRDREVAGSILGRAIPKA